MVTHVCLTTLVTIVTTDFWSSWLPILPMFILSPLLSRLSWLQRLPLFCLVATVSPTRQKCLILREFPILSDNNSSITPYYKIQVTMSRDWQKLKQANKFHCKLPILKYNKISLIVKYSGGHTAMIRHPIMHWNLCTWCTKRTKITVLLKRVKLSLSTRLVKVPWG